MSKIDDKLNEVLGIAEDITYENEVLPKKVNTELMVPEDKDPEIDFETGRKNLYNLLDKGNEAIDGILNLAKEGEHPRAYEVAGQLIKTVSEVSQNLLDLQEKLKKVKEVPDKMGTAERRWIQVERTLETPNEPYVEKSALKAEIQEWGYPLHFIDFETSAVALPFNKGRRPYEQIAFQFSHHTCYADGRIEHTSEYINNVPGEFPNFLFVSALKKALGKDNGTIFRFATHENSILNAIKNQLETSIYPDKKELIDFIKTITTPTQKSTDTWKASRPMIDLRVVILNYYYNPLTKGSNSLKAVLPAILNSCSFLKEKYTQSLENINLTSLNFGPNHIWLKFEDGKAVDPYKALPSIFEDWAPEKLDGIISGLSNISDGGGALTAYSKLQFVDMSTHERDTITTSLLKYCELDTLAMVMIYEHLLNISA